MPRSASQYFFGNSLVFFSDNGETHANIPVWMDLFAEAAGNSYAVSGGYGFLRNFADWETPLAQWGFAGVTGAWEPDETAFADAVFDSFVITPANFIQDVPPDTDYVGDTRSPLDAVLDVVVDLVTLHPDARLYVYEGWADMGPYAPDLPISESALAAYHAYTQSAYHDWFGDLVGMVNAALPQAQLSLIPVATLLSDLMTGVLSAIPAEGFYVDTAPHGTDTTYFLAAMITYQVTYGTPAPLPDTLPVPIDPRVLDAFDAINVVIETGLEAAGFVIDGPPVQLPDGYGDYDASYFIVDPSVTSLDQVDFDAAPVAVASTVEADFLNESGPVWTDGPDDHFAIRFDRTVDSPQGGIYELRLTSDLSARVHVDGVLVLDTEGGVPEETLVTQVTLSAGQHALEVHYLDVAGEASLQVDWHLVAPLPAAAAMPAPRVSLSTAQEPEPQAAPVPTTVAALMDPVAALPATWLQPALPPDRDLLWRDTVDTGFPSQACAWQPGPEPMREPVTHFHAFDDLL